MKVKMHFRCTRDFPKPQECVDVTLEGKPLTIQELSQAVRELMMKTNDWEEQ